MSEAVALLVLAEVWQHVLGLYQSGPSGLAAPDWLSSVQCDIWAKESLRSWYGVFSSVQLFSSTEEAQNFRDDRLHHQDFRWCLIFLICYLGEGQFPPKMIALLLQPLCFLLKVLYFLQIFATVRRSSQHFLLSLPPFLRHTKIIKEYYLTEMHILASPCAEHNLEIWCCLKVDFCCIIFRHLLFHSRASVEPSLIDKC